VRPAAAASDSWPAPASAGPSDLKDTRMPAELTGNDLRALADAFVTKRPRQPTAEEELLEKRYREHNGQHQVRLLEVMSDSGHFELTPLDEALLVKASLSPIPEPELSPEEKEAQEQSERIEAEEADDHEADRQHRLAQRQERRDQAAFEREVNQHNREEALEQIYSSEGETTRPSTTKSLDAEVRKRALIQLFAEAGIDLAKVAATNRQKRTARMNRAIEQAQGVLAEMRKSDIDSSTATGVDAALAFERRSWLRRCIAEINEIAAQLGVAGADGQFRTGHTVEPGAVDLGGAHTVQPERINLQRTQR
jgi:ribosomal protein L20A (L18A)